MIGVVYQDTPERVRDFLARYGDGQWTHQWTQLLDQSGRLAVDLGVTGPPETLFVDAGGSWSLNTSGRSPVS